MTSPESAMRLVAVMLISWAFIVSSAFAQTSAPSMGSPSRHVGMQNTREVQRALKVLGYDPGPVDGVTGRRTKAALADFQKAEGLSATGTLDAETRSKLTSRLREHVAQVQKALKETGFDPGPADGVVGEQTRAALRRYATAPAPSPPTAGSELIDRLRRAYDAGPVQSP